jgi:hypothetical protein
LKKDEINTQDFKGPLKGAVVIQVTADGGSHQQVTYHRPIGTTILDDDEWVMSSTEDVNTLIARTVDPFRQLRTGFEFQLLKSRAPEISGYTLDKDGNVRTAGKNNRLDKITRAKAIIKELWNAAYPPAEYLPQKGKKKPPARPKAHPKAYIVALGRDALDELNYVSLVEAPAVREAIGGVVPSTDYYTVAGEAIPRPQWAISCLKGKTTDEVRSALIASLTGSPGLISQGMRPGAPAPLPTPGSRVRKFIEEHKEVSRELTSNVLSQDALRKLVDSHALELRKDLLQFLQEHKEQVQPAVNWELTRHKQSQKKPRKKRPSKGNPVPKA